MMADAMLEVTGLNVFYGRAHILFDLAFHVGRGEVVVLLGRNGAGKSTTFKTLMGLVPPATGEIRFQGQPIHSAEPFRICRLGLGYVPEERRVFSQLSVLQNLEVGRQPPRQGYPLWTPERLFALFPNLGENRYRTAGYISGGEQQMLTIARTLMGNPAMILLDEPSEGLAPMIVAQLASTIGELKRHGVAVLLSEQNLNFAGQVGDRAYIIESGRLRYEGTMADLLVDDGIRQAYLAV